MFKNLTRSSVAPKITVIGTVLAAMVVASPASALVAPGGPVISEVTRDGIAVGDQGIKSQLRIPSTTGTSSTAYLRTYVGAFKDDDNWVKAGWNAGKCGGTDHGATPNPYFAYKISGTTTCEPATDFLSAGQYYEFRLSYNGSSWVADFRDTAVGSPWVSLGTKNAGFGSSVAYGAEGLEHNATAGATLPMPGTVVVFNDTQLKVSGSWVDWTGDSTATVKQDGVLDNDLFIGIAQKWNVVKMSQAAPDFSVNYPTTVAAPVGQQVSAAISVVANDTYDGVPGVGPAYEGPIVLELKEIPIGTIATWEGYAARVAAGGNPLDRTFTVYPSASDTWTVQLDLLTWEPLAADGPLNFTATGKDQDNNNLTKSLSIWIDR